jgi:uncharacterized membrane protein HdeD (DUF308 family)
LNEPPNGLTPPDPTFGLAPMLERVASYWCVELLLGLFWMVIAVVVRKFDQASVTTVGILTGLMFLVFAAEEFVLAAVDRHPRWLWAIFDVLLTASGIVALIHPTCTFAGFADILGFVFLLIGVMWMVQAFAERPINSLWWLIPDQRDHDDRARVLGQRPVLRGPRVHAADLAGVWAMTTGIIDVVRAFEIRELGRQLRPRSG